MIGKRSRPAIGKLAGAIRSGIVDLATSPRSPLDMIPRPKGLKNYDEGGVGLGIVVALDKSKNLSNGGEILAKYAICGPISSRSSPIPVSSGSSSKKSGANSDNNIEMMEGLEEEFTYVTCHGPNKSVTTRVYYDDREYGNTIGHNRTGFSGAENGRSIGVFNISPARLFEDPCGSNSDFLSSCHLCRKTLHGKDIYMYRGEKAFCSTECRQKQMKIDERKEKCRSEATRSTEVSTSSYNTYNTRKSQIFSPGIIAI